MCWQAGDSRAGCPYDNAMEEVAANIGRLIETGYNRDWLHFALDYLSPIEFEARLTRLGTAVSRRVSQSDTSSVP